MSRRGRHHLMERFWRNVPRLMPIAMAVLVPLPAMARQAGAGQADTTAHRLEALVVTAERSAQTIERSTQAITVVSRAELLASPARTLADALRFVPGLAFLDFDGSGGDPQVVMRGFYGGGEAEYVMLLVDGRPINAFGSGRIAWDMIPLTTIERIEIVRGGGSAAWGDSAIGGVINIITRSGMRPGGFASISAGEEGLLEGSLEFAGRWLDRPIALFGGMSDYDGFRSHAERTTGTVGASMVFGESDTRVLKLSTLHDWRDFDTPGPVSGTELAVSRSGSSPFYRFDRDRDRLHRVQLDSRWGTGSAARWSAVLMGEYAHDDRIRTVVLAPAFADTKNRVTGVSRVSGSVQAEWTGLAAAEDELMVGVDLSAGQLTSTWYEFVAGSVDEYTAAASSRGAIHARGSGRRMNAAAFFGYGVQVSSPVRLTVGSRVDWLRDTFDAEEPAASSSDATHIAVSPRVGLNLRYLATDRQNGHVYLSFARSFKAPTPEQLFDQRRFPVPFPPFEVGFANDALDPQYGTNVEAGIYHRTRLAADGTSAELSLTVYNLDLRDELDFDIETLRYQNIGKSRHRGIEAGLDVASPIGVGGFARYTHQAATHGSGDHDGKQLKAIPRHVLSAGVRTGTESGLATSVSATRLSGVHLDDANTLALPAWTRWDARVSWQLGRITTFVQATNLFDAEFNTTGYPDASDPGTVYYYPAAGRLLHVGIRHAW